MRDTPKPLAAALLAILLICSGLIVPAAQARSPRHHGHAGGQTRKRAAPAKTHGHARHETRRQAKQTATKPTKPTKPAKVAPAPHPHKEASARKHEQPSGGTAPAQNTTADDEARIAGVLATPCQNTEVIPTAQNLPIVEAATLCLINRQRAEQGVLPLAPTPDLERAAQSHCAELIEDDYFAHIAPDGETPVQRIEKTGYIPGPEVGYVIGENLAWGTYQLATPQSIVAAWMASPGHRANILESRYLETGIAITPAVPQTVGEGAPGATYAEEFGVIVH